MSLPRIHRHLHRRNRRLTSRSSSGQRSPGVHVVQTDRYRHRHHPLRERNQVEVVDVEAHGDCIDLTSDHGDEDVIDLTSPTNLHLPRAVNDLPVIVLNTRESESPPRRRHRHRSYNIENEIEQLDLDGTLSPDSIGSPPGLNVPTSDTVNSPGIRRITCPICMDDYKELQQNKVQLMSTVCGHLFCKPCIRAAVRANHQCPTCRKRLTDKQIHPIFL